MKKKAFVNSLIVIVFVVIALALGGCPDDNDDITGGGWIVTDSGKKVTFGFNFKCKCEDSGPKVSGQLQYNDREKGVRFHGVANSLYIWPDAKPDECDGLLNTWKGRYFGTYTLLPKYKEGEHKGKREPEGTFEIELVDVDNDERGPSKGDKLTLKLRECEDCDPWYTREAFLEGGNIQAHGNKS